MKIDKKILCESIGICALSWLAIPVIYWLILRKKKEVKEDGNGNSNIDGDIRNTDIHSE